ncbi:hypothetical protein Nepgr_027456 [Nepenthes gracilis]|uniref:RING-type domain-containing protein n=1 Tax=Nepenthes gracilis TaxID=150966 RepID=A0AAD3TAF0_NEPGR|nr:hypothetical protein Nepgr_027456 [Nepenthes gracilis]
MGNKLGRRRQVVDEKYTRPQGLYQIKDVDYKKLRKLILESKLAPCYPGGDECDCGFLEECPICFLYYPTLNRSRCCMKSICTECFLQMKNPNSTPPTQCPFCKTSNYAVEYRGVKSKEERGLEQIEEQKVIEAKIRMRQRELQDEEQRMHKREEINSSSGVRQTVNVDCNTSEGTEGAEVVSFEDLHAAPMLRQQQSRQNRDDEFDLDLEDIMVMEAIWLSIQENGRKRHTSQAADAPKQYAARDCYVSPVAATLAGSSSSPSGSLTCAIAALAECQQMGRESSSNYARNMSIRAKPMDTNYPPVESCCDDNGGMAVPRDGGDWLLDAESENSYGSSNELNDGTSVTALLPPPPPPLLPYRMVGNNYSISDETNDHGRRIMSIQQLCQQMGGESSSNYARDMSIRAKPMNTNYPPVESCCDDNGGTVVPRDGGDWLLDAESENSYGSSNELDDGTSVTALPPPPPPPLLPYRMVGNNYSISDETNDHGFVALPPPPPPLPFGEASNFQYFPGPIPESYEEQMMLAMAVSLVEARARTAAQGITWQ